MGGLRVPAYGDEDVDDVPSWPIPPEDRDVVDRDTALAAELLGVMVGQIPADRQDGHVALIARAQTTP
jgi:hypothetical protein